MAGRPRLVADRGTLAVVVVLILLLLAVQAASTQVAASYPACLAKIKFSDPTIEVEPLCVKKPHGSAGQSRLLLDVLPWSRRIRRCPRCHCSRSHRKLQDGQSQTNAK